MLDDQKVQVQMFFKQWQLYQSVIEHNYMCHREVTQNLCGQLRKHALQHVDILEIGCGDASIVAQLLHEGLSINSYLGIDLSSQALDVARRHLEGRVDSLTLQCRDMVTSITDLAAQQKTFDIILAGYSLHHLNSAAVASLLANSRQLLHDGGIMIVVDIMRYHNETLELFTERNARYIRSWKKLSADQIDRLIQHIHSSDFPESFDGWCAMADQAGFDVCELTFRDARELHAVLVLYCE